MPHCHRSVPLSRRRALALGGGLRRAGWDVECLYNQETDEEPQLY